MIEHAMLEGFLYPEHLELIIKTAISEDILPALRSYFPPAALARWVDRK